VAVFLSPEEYRRLEAVVDRLIPAEGGPGGVEAGAVDYIDTMLGAFAFDPPRLFAGGPFSGRHGGERGFGEFIRPSRLQELAWRIRLEGSQGIPEREFNGPVVGLQQRYREGLAALGEDFERLDGPGKDERLRAHREFAELVYGHACEAMYGPPEYGGNRGLVGWRAIGFEGDVQPRGYTDAEVAEP
jgi:hypothetical protein